MAPGRSQSQQRRRQIEQRRRQQGIQAAGSSELVPSIESDTGPSTRHTAVRGHSGLVYDVQRLPRDKADRASAGLRSTEFVAVFCRTITAGNGSKPLHGIQLEPRGGRTGRRPENIAIRIYEPEDGSHRVECSCSDYLRSSSVCIHQYWLYDGLNAVVALLPPSSTQTVTEENVRSRMTGLYDEIGRCLPQPGFLQRLSTGRAEETFSDSYQDTRGDGSSADDSGEITEIIRAIISVFDPDSHLATYGADFIRSFPMTVGSFENLADPDNLSTTISGLARHDSVFRQHLLNRDLCADQLFRKLGTMAQEVFDRFDHYAESRANYNGNFVKECANILKLIVEKIVEYMDDQAPLAALTKSKAASVLVNILNNVCDHNRDIYIDQPWQTPHIPHYEDDRNLYIYLIRDKLEDNEDPEEESCFVVDTLLDLPSLELGQLTEDLNTILSKLRRNRASAVFLRRLEEVIAASQGGVQPDPFEISFSP